MAEARDPAIKLFGREIPLQETPMAAAAAVRELVSEEKDICEEITSTEFKNSTLVSVELDQGERNNSSCMNNDNENNHQTSTQENKATADIQSEQDQTEADTSGKEKVLKKPDKLLPCPRCSSMDTKFCYYNNYNVNQPRHFCKNCQRYWTAGGTMRNVPVGAGRRKNKHSASHCHQAELPSDGLASSRLDAPDSPHQALSCAPASIRPSKGSVTVLKFGSEAPLSESMVSVLNLREPKINIESGHTACEEKREEPSCASSVTASTCVENGFSGNLVPMEQNSMQGYCNGVAPVHPLQCYPGPPWPYTWPPGWSNVAAAAAAATPGQGSELAYAQENRVPTPITWCRPPIIGAPAFCAPTIPFPFMPASWGCVPVWASGNWNLPLVGTNGGLSPTSSTSNSGCSGSVSPNLGKHSRDANSESEEKMEKSLWIPKTLRIDHPEEASKSSIWATLGIKPEVRGMFKDYKSKSQGEGQASDATQALHANPAALSRSQSFQEST